MNKYLTTAMTIMFMGGCGANIPECNTLGAKQDIRAHYYDKTSNSSHKVQLTFDRITTEKVDTATKSRTCTAEITALLTPALLEQLDMESEGDDLVLALSIVGIKKEAS